MGSLIFNIGLAFLSAAWGFNSHIMKKAMVGENPMRAIGIRSLFTAPFLIGTIVIISGSHAIFIYFSVDVLPLVVFTSMLMIFGDGIFLFGLKYHDVSTRLPIASIYPFFIVLILILSDTEDVSKFTIVGTLILSLELEL